MIKVSRASGYRPCDWNDDCKCSYMVSVNDHMGQEKHLFACKAHLTLAVLKAIDFEDSGSALYPE